MGLPEAGGGHVGLQGCHGPLSPCSLAQLAMGRDHSEGWGDTGSSPSSATAWRCDLGHSFSRSLCLDFPICRMRVKQLICRRSHSMLFLSLEGSDPIILEAVMP